MVLRFNECSPRIRKHIKESKRLSVDPQGVILLDEKNCAAEDIINQLVREGAITINELMELLK